MSETAHSDDEVKVIAGIGQCVCLIAAFWWLQHVAVMAVYQDSTAVSFNS